MAKSNRKKKQDRARTSARKAERTRARARADRQREADERALRMMDPKAGPAEVAELLTLEDLDPMGTCAIVMTRIESGAPPADIAEIARTVLEGAAEPPEAWKSVVAAWAAHLADQEEDCESRRQDLVTWAGSAGDAGTRDAWRAQVATVVMLLGHPGQSRELLEPLVLEEPDHPLIRDLYASTFVQAFRALRPGEESGIAQPGGFKPGPAEQATLDRFAAASGLDALRVAIGEFLDQTSYGKRLGELVESERAETEGKDDVWTQADRDLFEALASERAIMFRLSGDDSEDNILRAFAADPDVPAELADRALAWDNHAHYGAWQVKDPSPGPGIACTDLVSGARRYAQFPAGALEGAAPWGVWLGVLVPVDGIWRSTGRGLWLTPAEGDAIAEAMSDAASRALLLTADVPEEEIPELHDVRFGQAEPYCVLWETGDEEKPEFSALFSNVSAGMLLRMAQRIWWKRSRPFHLQNTSGDPLLLIDATIEVTDGTEQALLERPDFGEEEDGVEGQIIWWGDEPEYDDMERTIFGRLTLESGRLLARVNSRQRLRDLLTILTEAGASPRVAGEKHCAPSPDFAWGPVPDLAVDGPVEDLVWEKRWLDLPLVPLDFDTPRIAIQGDEDEQLQVEALLRQLEHQSTLVSARGDRPVDVAWLRAELSRASDLALRPVRMTVVRRSRFIPGFTLLQQGTPVHGQRNAGDVAGFVGEKEQDGVGDVLALDICYLPSLTRASRSVSSVRPRWKPRSAMSLTPSRASSRSASVATASSD